MAEQADIERAFSERFATLGYTYVSTPNGPTTGPTATDMNYSLDFLYNDGFATGIGESAYSRYQGFFQVTIHVPVVTATGDAPGLYVGLTSAKAIADLFPRGLSIGYPSAAPVTYVHCQTPTIKHLGKTTPEWYSLIVRVPFWSDI